MNTCPECGRSMKTFPVYHWHNRFLGNMKVPAPDNEYRFCSKCKTERFTYLLMKRIEREEQKRTEQLLLQSVNCDMLKFKENLILANGAARLLEISLQKFIGNGRHRTLIFKFKHFGRVFYWKPSVLLFKEKGDGRFKLYGGVK